MAKLRSPEGPDFYELELAARELYQEMAERRRRRKGTGRGKRGR